MREFRSNYEKYLVLAALPLQRDMQNLAAAKDAAINIFPVSLLVFGISSSAVLTEYVNLLASI